MTKLISNWFWYLGCWSKGQILSKELDDPYIWKQLYLTEDTFQFSTLLAHFHASIFCFQNRGLLWNYIPQTGVSVTYLHMIYSCSNRIIVVHSTAHRLPWEHGLSIPFPCSSLPTVIPNHGQPHPNIFWSTRPLQNTSTVIKAVLAKMKNQRLQLVL